MEEQAVSFVMDFYEVSEEVARHLYRDEVEAYMRLLQQEKLSEEVVYNKSKS